MSCLNFKTRIFYVFISVLKIGESTVYANFCSNFETDFHRSCTEMRFLPQVNKAVLYVMKLSKSLETKCKTSSVSQKLKKIIHS